LLSDCRHSKKEIFDGNELPVENIPSFKSWNIEPEKFGRRIFRDTIG